MFDLLIRGGHVVDPKNGIDLIGDIAIEDGHVDQVAKEISPVLASEVYFSG